MSEKLRTWRLADPGEATAAQVAAAEFEREVEACAAAWRPYHLVAVGSFRCVLDLVFFGDGISAGKWSRFEHIGLLDRLRARDGFVEITIRPHDPGSALDARAALLTYRRLYCVAHVAGIPGGAVRHVVHGLGRIVEVSETFRHSPEPRDLLLEDGKTNWSGEYVWTGEMQEEPLYGPWPEETK